MSTQQEEKPNRYQRLYEDEKAFFDYLFGQHGIVAPGLDFQANQWTGFVEKKDFDRHGNYLSLGPLPPGWPSALLTVAGAIAVKKLSQTPAGLRVLSGLASKYLDNIGEIIKGIHFSSSSNVYTALINAFTAQPIYMRLGLMSPKDALQNRAWIDHVMGEMLRMGYFKESLAGLTTLVHAPSVSKGMRRVGSGARDLAANLGAASKTLAEE